MMTPRVLVVAVAIAALAACSNDGTRHAQPPTTTERHTSGIAAAPTTPTTSATDRYNPTHDTTKCVRLLPNGQVVFVEILLVPGQPKPAYVNGAKCG